MDVENNARVTAEILYEVQSILCRRFEPFGTYSKPPIFFPFKEPRDLETEVPPHERLLERVAIADENNAQSRFVLGTTHFNV
jgi:hypothetical protein